VSTRTARQSSRSWCRRRSTSSRSMRSRWRMRPLGHGQAGSGGGQGHRGACGSRDAWSRTHDSTRLASATTIGLGARRGRRAMGRSVAAREGRERRRRRGSVNCPGLVYAAVSLQPSIDRGRRHASLFFGFSEF
jgi:hypothetical protein